MHNTCIQLTTAFDWDEESKAGKNFRKHGVRLPEAIPVFDDPFAITAGDYESDLGEERFVTVGIGARGRVLVVAYTCRHDDIRLISARLATPHEREQYEAQL